MNLSRAFRGAHPGSWLVIILAFVAALPCRAAIDLNTDGIPDIWATVYGGGNLTAADDTDGDGCSNAAEAAAGTNPFLPASSIRITAVTREVDGVRVSFSTLGGKRYQVQSNVSLDSSNWQDVGSPLAMDPILVTAVVLATGSEKFFRVVVLEADDDNDGVTDWEEIAVGFDPHNSHSGGLSGDDDLATITGALQAANVVTIVAVDANAIEPAAGAPSADTGGFLIRRTGNLNALTVNYSVTGGAAPGGDYVPLTGAVQLPMGVNSATVVVTPLADSVSESSEAVILTVNSGANYGIGSPATAAVLIGDNVTVNGDGLWAQFWNEGSTVLGQNAQPSFSGPPNLSRVDSSVDWQWTSGQTPGPAITDAYWSSRWSGEVLPEFAQIYTFSFETNFAGRVWVNGQKIIDNWPPVAVVKDRFDVAQCRGSIALEAGVRYPIVVEHYQDGGTGRARLRWTSANQAEQLIPRARLFSNPAPQILSTLEVLLIKNSGPYSYQIRASGNPTSYSAVNLPSGWSINTATGIISGTPTEAGDWQIPISATNSVGSGAAVLDLRVIETGNAITREVWNGVAGNAVTDIPLTSAPTASAPIGSLEGPRDVADQYGARIRGYITAPVTGVYQFWLAGDEAAELWMSDDDEPANLWKRAGLTAPTAFRDWASAAATPLLYLKAGQRYYVEVLHKEAAGLDHVSVGWLKPGETGNVPSEIVPGYVLSPYVPPAATPGLSTLYTTNMLSQGGAATGGFGSASLQLSADETGAILNFSYANLSTPVTAAHIHADPWRGIPSQIIFDIDAAIPQQDGSYIWEIEAAGRLTAAEMVQIIKEGASYINVHTDNYPDGEIRGNFRLQAASQIFTPPPPPPGIAPSTASSDAAAARFLAQATYGASLVEINALRAMPSFQAWIDNEFAKPATHHLDYVEANRNRTDPGNATYNGTLTFNAWWKNSITAPDQLRQRVAFALSEILVVSEAGVLDERANALSYFYDTLLDHSFGNFRDILEAVTLTPAMGLYLDMRKNDKPDPATGRIPNENYAREILQLFSIGLNRMHPDGSLMLNSKGQPIPTYDQDVVIGFSHVFTGWNYNQANGAGNRLPTRWDGVPSDYVNPMKLVPTHHDLGQKRILNNVVLPAASITNPADPLYDNNGLNDLDAALNAIFNHPNTGPFICRQLIQRLVTSTPSRGYLYRVVQKFNDNGSGIRGDMKAVIKAILLDFEARDSSLLGQQGFGKQREPLLRITGLARAFAAPPSVSGTYVQNGGTISITTTAPHKLASGNSAFLDFTTGVPSPATDGSYSVSSSPAPTQTTFTVPAKDVFIATYTQSANLIHVTTAANHGLATGDAVHLAFTTGGAPSGAYVITVDDANEFDVTAPDSATRTGSNLLVFYRGGFTQSGTVLTLTTTVSHNLNVGDTVTLTFDVDSGSTSLANGAYVVATVVDATRFTLAAASAATRYGDFVMGPATAITSRNGAISLNFGNWAVGSTDTDLAQTPLRAPTVFNFFEPDYQFPGELAAAGLITPEFQLSSDTNVIRQANFLYNGIFNPSGNTAGLSSFRGGANNVVMDLSPWMQTRPGSSSAWTSNENLSSLVDKLDDILLGGQLPGAARTLILSYVSNTANIAYNNTTPTDAQKRDRLRAVVHLLATSPEFTIQK